MSESIAASLISLAVSCDDLQVMADNPRRGDVESVAKSLDRFGQRKPIVYRQKKTGLMGGAGVKEVIAGNHTLMAARQLGWTQIAAVDADDLTDEEARAYALADNKTSDLGAYDREALVAFVSGLAAKDPDYELLAAASFSESEVMLALNSITSEQFKDGFLDDLIGDSKITFSDELSPEDRTGIGLVPLTVMVDKEARKEIMLRLQAMCDDGAHDNSGAALTALVLGE